MTQSWQTEDNVDTAPNGTGYRRRSGKAGILLILGLFAAGLGVFYYLGQRDLTEVTPDGGVTGREYDERTDRILADLQRKSEGNRSPDMLVAAFYNHQNLPPELRGGLSRDPFVNVVEGPTRPDPNGGGKGGGGTQHVDSRIEFDRLSALAEQMTVTVTIVKPKGSSALIGTQYVTKGGMIGEFKVIDIQSDKVVLSAGGWKFVRPVRTGPEPKE
ncbi:MAG: hypothetical protein WCJ97_06885 [Phycisphaerae bacterium]